MTSGWDRRRFLTGLSLAGTGVLAGCSFGSTEQDNSGGSSDGASGTADAGAEESENTDTPTLEDSDTVLESSSLSGLQYVPVITDDRNSGEGTVQAVVQDANGIAATRVLLNSQAREEPLEINAVTNIGQNRLDTTATISNTVLTPGENTVLMEVADQQGNERTLELGTHETSNNGWQIDLKHTSNGSQDGNIGGTNTRRGWDDILFDLNSRTTEQVQEWHETAVYDSLMEDLENDSQIEYSSDEGGEPFSNVWYGQAEQGHWDLEWFQGLTELNEILLDIVSALQIHQSQIYDAEPSSANGRFAATAEQIFNELNHEAQRYQEENNEQLVNWGYVNEGGHGTTVMHVDTENSEIQADHPWQFVDTTGDTVEPITAELQQLGWSDGAFNPFTMGYEPESQSTGYETEKLKSDSALLSFITHDRGADGYDWEFSFNDSIHEFIFNEHVPERGSVDPILDLSEKMIDAQMETGEYIVAVGEDIEVTENQYGEEVFDGVELYAGDEELYQMSMDEDITLTHESVESYMQQTAR